MWEGREIEKERLIKEFEARSKVKALKLKPLLKKGLLNLSLNSQTDNFQRLER